MNNAIVKDVVKEIITKVTGIKFSNMYKIRSQSVIDALINDDYDLSEKPDNIFSATEVIDAPKAKVLWKRHKKEVVVDVSDNFHTMDGSAIHYVVEKSNKKAGRLSEERLYIDVTTGEVYTLPENTPWFISDKEGNRIINPDIKWYNPKHYYVSCKFDNYIDEEMCLEDYKRTSVYEAKGGLKVQRVQQLNIGAYALDKIGFPVKKVRACLFLKDWSAAMLKKEEQSAASNGWTCKYPPIPYAEFEPEVWSDEQCLTFIQDRVQLHVVAQSLSDDKIPPCTPDERWYRGESFAIVKEGLKTAKKVVKVDDYDSREQALQTAEIALQQYRDEKPKDAALFSIETRPGNDGRCNGDKKYCHVCQWCNYWQETYKDKIAVETEY